MEIVNLRLTECFQSRPRVRRIDSASMTPLLIRRLVLLFIAIGLTLLVMMVISRKPSTDAALMYLGLS